MKVKASIIVTSLIALAIAGHVSSEPETEANGEALAWTVAAYASCESEEEMQRDLRAESAAKRADVTEVTAALKLLSSSTQVCEGLNTYAADMLTLAATEPETFRTRFIVEEDPAMPVFAEEVPEGNGAPEDVSIILDSANTPPPQSAPNNPTSDYQ